MGMDTKSARSNESVTIGEMSVKLIIREKFPLLRSAKGETLGQLIDAQLNEMQEHGAEVLSVTVTLPQDEV